MLPMDSEDREPTSPGKRSVLDARVSEFSGWMADHGQPDYRVRQILEWIIRRRAESFDCMSDVPLVLRRELEAEWLIFGSRIVFHDRSPDGTHKLLLECRDGRRIECVLIMEDQRHTVCVSTQVGCGMGCVFCASALKGLERNLTTGEMIEQVLRLRNLLPPGDSVSHIVVMGMGESLANLDNLVAALDRLCSIDAGLGLSQRRVTISTVGLPEKIRKLAILDRQYHLAISLHAPTEDLRNRLVPVNEKIGLTAVFDAADFYFKTTGRQVTYEYILLHGINDRLQDARILAKRLRGRKSHVNLIPYNPVAGLTFERPSPEDIRQFVAILRAQGISTTVRKTKGRAIDAACGQLRRRLADHAFTP
jgi:23S rRNA (adenine2503-C2)-methyltransferase